GLSPHATNSLPGEPRGSVAIAGNPAANGKPGASSSAQDLVGMIRREGSKVRPPSWETASTMAFPSTQVVYTAPSRPTTAWNPRSAPLTLDCATPGSVLIAIGLDHVFPSSVDRANRISLFSRE